MEFEFQEKRCSHSIVTEIIELIYVFEEKGPNCWIELSMLPWIPPVR